MTRICFVAAPLVARTGVYRSARETVDEARNCGYEWSLLLGISDSASSAQSVASPSWVEEFAFEPAGLSGIKRLRRRLLENQMIREADWVISLNPQTDMALAGTSLDWIAYLRGLPWPGDGEGSAIRGIGWKLIEAISLRRAALVWATTTTLQRSIRPWINAEIVPAGIRRLERSWDGCGIRNVAVWAARYDVDKNPFLFVDMIRSQNVSGLRGQMFGSGPLQSELFDVSCDSLAVGGFVSPERLWDGAMAYVGTSFREAFGRSAVEAAMNGIPVVVADTFGAAELIYKDPELRRRFVLDVRRRDLWTKALEDLASDEGLRTCVSEHVYQNAQALTVAASVSAIKDRVNDVI